MVNTMKIRSTVVKGLKDYLGIPLVRSNQTAPMPKMPYGWYTVTTPSTANNGTYGEYEDGKARKPVKQIWSITYHSTDEDEAIEYANKARTWLDYSGTVYLNDNEVIVEDIGAVGDRSNLLTSDYYFSYGFDVTFWVMDETDMPDNGEIESIEIGETVFNPEPSENDLNESLEKRLDGEVV